MVYVSSGVFFASKNFDLYSLDVNLNSFSKCAVTDNYQCLLLQLCSSQFLLSASSVVVVLPNVIDSSEEYERHSQLFQSIKELPSYHEAFVVTHASLHHQSL